MFTYPKIIAMFIAAVVAPWAFFTVMVGSEFGAFIGVLMLVAFLITLPAYLSDRRWGKRLDRIGK